MKVLTVAAGKGGTAKTTTAVSVAGVLAEQGRRVLVVDLDSQGTATTYLGAKTEGRALLDLFLEGGSLADIAPGSNNGNWCHLVIALKMSGAEDGSGLV